MRLTTGEVISYDNKIKLGYNHKKNAVKNTDYRHYFKCRSYVLTMQI